MPSCILSEMLVVDKNTFDKPRSFYPQTIWRYHKAHPIYYHFMEDFQYGVFSFYLELWRRDLDLSNVNIYSLLWFWTFVPQFTAEFATGSDVKIG